MNKINLSSSGMRLNPRECIHKEIFLGRWILEDENGLRLEVCKKCWRRLRFLKGIKIIEHGMPIYRTANDTLLKG